MLKSGSSDFIDTMVPNFDYSPDEELVDAKNKSRVYTSHLYPRHFPKQFLEKCCKIILVYRNPKDVAASYFNINNKMKSYNEGGLSFSEFLKCYLSGNGNYICIYIIIYTIFVNYKIYEAVTRFYEGNMSYVQSIISHCFSL